jgi:hypothetical protein
LLNCKINIAEACLIAEAKGANQICIVDKSKLVEVIEDFRFTPPEYVSRLTAKSNMR